MPDQDLIDGLNASKKVKMNFLLVVNSKNQVAKMIVQKKPITSRDKLKSEHGGTQTFMGVCQKTGPKGVRLELAQGEKPLELGDQKWKNFMKDAAGIATPEMEILSYEEQQWNKVRPDIELMVKEYLQGAPPNAGAVGDKFKLTMRKVASRDFAGALEDLPELKNMMGEKDVVESGPAPPTAVDADKLQTLQADFVKFQPAIKEFASTFIDRRMEILKPTKVVKDFLAAPTSEDQLQTALAALATIQGLLGELTQYKSAVRQAEVKWNSAQSAVTKVLTKVKEAISAAEDPEKDKALIELKSVISNLVTTPKTPQQVSEIESYLKEDDVIEDICSLAGDIRKPLLSATDALKTALS